MFDQTKNLMCSEMPRTTFVAIDSELDEWTARKADMNYNAVRRAGIICEYRIS